MPSEELLNLWAGHGGKGKNCILYRRPLLPIQYSHFASGWRQKHIRIFHNDNRLFFASISLFLFRRRITTPFCGPSVVLLVYAEAVDIASEDGPPEVEESVVKIQFILLRIPNEPSPSQVFSHTILNRLGLESDPTRSSSVVTRACPIAVTFCSSSPLREKSLFSPSSACFAFSRSKPSSPFPCFSISTLPPCTSYQTTPSSQTFDSG